MTVHQCPKCELKFGWKTEVDDHCWHDHPEFRHEYPAHAVEAPKPPKPAAASTPPPAPVAKGRHHADGGALVRWLVPPESHEHR